MLPGLDLLKLCLRVEQVQFAYLYSHCCLLLLSMGRRTRVVLKLQCRRDKNTNARVHLFSAIINLLLRFTGWNEVSDPNHLKLQFF